MGRNRLGIHSHSHTPDQLITASLSGWHIQINGRLHTFAAGCSRSELLLAHPGSDFGPEFISSIISRWNIRIGSFHFLLAAAIAVAIVSM